MSTTTPSSLQLLKGPLAKLWNATAGELTTTDTPDIVDGNLYIGYDSTEEKAMWFMDIANVRYPITAPTKWTELIDIPTSVSNLDSTLTTIGSTYLPIAGGTITGPIVLSGGDGTTTAAGKISLDQTLSGQITDKTTSTLFGFLQNNTDTLTIGHSSYKIALRGPTGTKPTFNGKQVALFEDIPTDFTTTTAATNAETNAKNYADLVVANCFTTFTSNTSKNQFTISNTANSKSYTWTANDHYPTKIEWTYDDTTGALQGVMSMKNNSTAATGITFSGPPAATPLKEGIVSTSEQSFSGNKNFATSISLGGGVQLTYNTGTESLNFSFLS